MRRDRSTSRTKELLLNACSGGAAAGLQIGGGKGGRLPAGREWGAAVVDGGAQVVPFLLSARSGKCSYIVLGVNAARLREPSS